MFPRMLSLNLQKLQIILPNSSVHKVLKSIGSISNLNMRRIQSLGLLFLSCAILHVEGQLDKGETKPLINLPTCTLRLFEVNYPSSTPQVEINFPSDLSRGTPCKPENKGIGESQPEKKFQCAGRNVSLDQGEQVSGHQRIQINCTAAYPVDFNLGQDVPFTGVDVTLGRDENISWVAATFPATIGANNEGLEKYSGEYIFFPTESPDLGARFTLSIKSAKKPSYNESRKMCLKIFDDRADCSIGHSDTELYLANIGGNNPTETRILKSCLENQSKPCGNKFRGAHCVQDRYCKKIFHIHSHGLIQCTSDNVTQTVQYFTDLDADIRRVGDGKSFSEIFPDDAVIRVEQDDKKSTMEILYDDTHDSNEVPEINNNGEECNQMQTVVHPRRMNGTIVLSDKQKHGFECHFIPYLLVHPVFWSVEFQNGTVLNLFNDYGGNTTSESKFFRQSYGEEVTVNIASSHLQVSATPAMKNIVCEAYYWNASKKAKGVQGVHVENSLKG